ncbi:MAG: hypothetical protein ACRC2O_13655 [Chitinophagaceae bacterium]
MSEPENLLPVQVCDVHFSSEIELEDDDELYEFDDFCLKNPEEVTHVDDSQGKPQSPLSR